MARFWLVLLLSLIQPAQAQEHPGKTVAFGTAKGNCLACHLVPGDPVGETGGNIGPPLIGMAARFPDRERLRAQVFDATVAKPDTMMPPFGRNKILTDAEIEAVVGYLLTL